MSRGRKKVAFIGGTECGKSTQLKLLLDVPRVAAEGRIIYDRNYQKAWSHLPEINMDQWFKMVNGFYRIADPDFGLFYEIAKDKWKRGWKGTIGHEDAGEDLSSQKNTDVYGNIIGLRHKATDWLGVFHSGADTPPYILRQMNEIVLFKTGDNWSKIADRFPDDKVEEVKKWFEWVNQSENKFAFKRIILRATGTL
ncbi:MAG: hypothetical protein V4721_16500 [Bacteroidota bacterium]